MLQCLCYTNLNNTPHQEENITVKGVFLILLCGTISVAINRGQHFFSALTSVSALFVLRGGKSMYKKMYLTLFNAITAALEENNLDIIKEILKNAQINAEEICINSNDEI